MPEDTGYVSKDDYVKLQKELYAMEGKFEAVKGERDKKQDEIYRLKKQIGVESTAKNEKKEDPTPPPSVPPITVTQPATVTYNSPSYPQNSVTNSGFTPPIQVMSAPQPEEKHIHNFKYFQPFCTGGQCGINSKNPEFVPEMKCKNCNGVVGSFESVKKRVITGDQPNCPFCGQDLKAVPITDEAKRKVQEYLASPKVAVPA